MNIDDILKMDDAHKEIVCVPEWGNAELVVWSMTAAERSEIEKRWSSKPAGSDPLGFRRDVLARTLKAADGSPLGTPEQIDQLMNKNARAIERLFEAACRVSGLMKSDVEELEKN